MKNKKICMERILKKYAGVALAVAVCLCLFGCGKKEDAIRKQQSLKQEGMELQIAGDYEGAIKKYDEALQCANMKVGSGEIDIAYYKASAQCRSGDLEGAIATYSAVLDLKEDINAYLGRGLLYIKAADAKKAEEDLNRVLKETDDPLIKGIIYQVVDQPEKAKEYFEKAKKAGNQEAAYFLSKIYKDVGDQKYAMTLLEEYLEGSSVGAEGYLTAARIYFTDGAYEEALSTVQKGIALGESGVLKNLMQEEIACYEKLGNFDAARDAAASYLEKYPKDAEIQKESEFLKSR